MKLYILDTNIAGFAMQAHPSVLRHIGQLPDGAEVVTTVITVGEAIGGWLPLCRRATDGAARAQAYLRLQQAFDFYRAKGLNRPRQDLRNGVWMLGHGRLWTPATKAAVQVDSA